jgi:catechol 2,3-dioxygenase
VAAALRQPSENDPLRGHPDSRLPGAGDVREIVLESREISAGADVGHVNLRVTDLERSLAFYRDVLGLHVTQRDAESVFLAAGEYHHHLALNVWGTAAKAAPPGAAGLHHFALRLPDEAALAEVVVRILQTGHRLLGATDHGVNIAVYLRDPDGNGVELMVDRPDAEWPRGQDGGIAMRVEPLDLTGLLADAFEIDSRPTGG